MSEKKSQTKPKSPAKSMKGHGYDCDKCDRKGFKSPQALNMHKTRTHGPKRKKSVVEIVINFCPFCGKRLPNAMFVPRKGRKTIAIPVAIQFCTACGKQLPNAMIN